MKHSGLLYAHYTTYRNANACEFKAVEAHVGNLHVGGESSITAADMWKAAFKDMCIGAYKKWVEFCADQLTKAGRHVSEDGPLANPDAETKKRLATTMPTNKLAESAFGIYDRLLRTITNASSVTLSAMTAAKFTKPFEWIRRNTTPDQQYHLFNWLRKIGTERAIIELKKTADQKKEAQEDEQALYEKATLKELDNAKEWEMLRLLKGRQQVASSAALKAGIQNVMKETKGLSASQRKKSTMTFLKMQRKFLFLDGLPVDEAPYLKHSTPSGSKVDYTPDEFGQLLGEIIDKVKNGEFESLMKPIVPISQKLEELTLPFRGGHQTPFMKKYYEDEHTKLHEMVEEVKRNVDAVLTIQKTKKNRNQSKKKAPRKLTNNLQVWVVDEDPNDMEVGDRVWEATVQSQTLNVPGSWDLRFEGELVTVHYPREAIFLTKGEADAELLIY